MSHNGTGPVVSFENVSKHYGQLKAVDGLSLDLRAGETVALLGPNGAGKSTSLDMLLALRKPTAGKIQMFGNDPYHAVKSGRVGAMLQSGGLMPDLTAWYGSSPNILIFPDVGFRSARSMSSEVDLPAPFGPRSATVSPARRSRLSPSTAFN